MRVIVDFLGIVAWIPARPARVSTLLVLTCLLFLAGCGEEEQQGDWPELVLEEEFRIDGQEAVLSTITLLAARRDGLVAVAERPFQGLRFFDRAGAPLPPSFPEGEGPGEFQSVGGLGWLADTLWAFDGSLRRFTLISADLQLLRTVQYARQARPDPSEADSLPSFRSSHPLALLPDGSTIRMLYTPDPESDIEYPLNVVTYATVSKDGMIQNVLARIPEGRSDFSVQLPGGGSAAGSFPFPMKPRFGISPDGSRAVYADMDYAAGESTTLQILSIFPSGDTIYAIQYPVPAVPIPSRVADSVLDAGVAMWERINPEVAEAYRRQASVPPIYPPIREVMVGRDGSVWLRGYGPGARQPYRVLGPDGNPRGHLALPGASRVMAADDSLIWVVEVDEFDVPSIVTYSVSEGR